MRSLLVAGVERHANGFSCGVDMLRIGLRTGTPRAFCRLYLWWRVLDPDLWVSRARREVRAEGESPQRSAGGLRLGSVARRRGKEALALLQERDEGVHRGNDAQESPREKFEKRRRSRA